MIHLNALNLKLSNSKLNKLKSEIKDNTEVTLKISSNDVYNFQHNFQSFVKLLQMVHQLIKKKKKLDRIK